MRSISNSTNPGDPSFSPNSQQMLLDSGPFGLLTHIILFHPRTLRLKWIEGGCTLRSHITVARVTPLVK